MERGIIMEYRLIKREQTLNPVRLAVPEESAGSFQVRKGEYFTFQLLLRSEKPLTVQVCPDKFPEGVRQFTVFQQEGIDGQGRPWRKPICLEAGRWKLLWVGFLLSEEQETGRFTGAVRIISPGGETLLEVPVALDVLEEIAADHGFGDIWNHSRLAWLNSDRGLDSRITKPYQPVQRNGDQLHIVGRTVELQSNGLIRQMRSSFCHDNSVISQGNGLPLFQESPAFFLGEEPLKEGRLTFTEENEDGAAWVGQAAFSKGNVEIYGRLEYDGCLSMQIRVYPEEDFQLKDVQLKFAYRKDSADYFIGLGYEGGFCPDSWDWEWDAEKRQDSFFLGTVNRGMQIQLMDRFYHAPHVNIYYHNNPLRMPDGWFNQGKGGISLRRGTDSCRVNIFCGETAFSKGTVREYCFRCFFTPMKPINWKDKWSRRYFHRNSVPDSFEKVRQAKESFANVVNLHHGSDLIPFINYPFFEEEKLARLTADAHRLGIQVKPYYTVRELTNRIPEIFPFLSLGEEIYPADKGITQGVPEQGGLDPWIKENLGADRVIAAWKTTVRSGRYQGESCASIIVNSQSRIVNFYMEGLSRLVQKCGIDGVYIDDTGMDRTALRRLRKILDSQKDGCQVDLHAWNHFEDHYGAGYCCNMNLYLPLFPYLDRIWFGEAFRYRDTKPDYWMSAICGIMYGVPGEMLGEESNNYKGLIYGMTNRVYEESECSPVPLWKFLAQWGIQDATLLGYWDPDCPIRSGDPEVPVSVYRKGAALLIVAANFADEPRQVRLRSASPGIQTADCPEIPQYQPACGYTLGSPMELQPGEGRILLSNCAL